MYILVFGDSIAHGSWDARGGWVQRLKTFMDARTLRNADKYAEVYNLGVGGDTSRDVFKRFERETSMRVDDKEEVMFIFQFGINDSIFFYSDKNLAMSEEEFIRNVNDIISAARKFSRKIVFLGLTQVDAKKVDPVPWAGDKAYRNVHVKQFDGMLKKICADSGVHYIDMSKTLAKKDLEDGLHPNSDGHDKIYKVVRDYLVENKLI